MRRLRLNSPFYLFQNQNYDFLVFEKNRYFQGTAVIGTLIFFLSWIIYSSVILNLMSRSIFSIHFQSTKPIKKTLLSLDLLL